jgi:hypothetical protein
MTEEYSDDNSTKDLLYDLRQYYAKIVGEILIEIATARKEKRFTDYYDWLDSLHTEINQKLTDTERKEYDTNLKIVIDILNNNRNVYLGKTHDNDDKNVVFSALNELEMWLRDKMEDHGMFGRKWDEEGL